MSNPPEPDEKNSDRDILDLESVGYPYSVLLKRTTLTGAFVQVLGMQYPYFEMEY